MANNSFTLERTIVESSAFFVTLLFIITEKPASDPFLMFVGVFFVTAALAAFLAMTGVGEYLAKILQYVEMVAFTLGLFLLAIRFVAGTNRSLLYVFVGVLIYAVFGGILAIVTEILRGRRERKEYRERMRKLWFEPKEEPTEPSGAKPSTS